MSRRARARAHDRGLASFAKHNRGHDTCRVRIEWTSPRAPDKPHLIHELVRMPHKAVNSIVNIKAIAKAQFHRYRPTARVHFVDVVECGSPGFPLPSRKRR